MPASSRSPASVNHVLLIGRVSGDPVERRLPSGDVVVTLRIVVPRPTGGPVDTIDLACWSASTRHAAMRRTDGDQIVVEGALRRRFFRTGGSAASRYEVEVGSLKKAAAIE